MTEAQCQYPGCDVTPRTGPYCYDHRFLGGSTAAADGRLRMPDVRAMAAESASEASAVLLRSRALVAARPRMYRLSDGSVRVERAQVRGYVWHNPVDSDDPSWVTLPHAGLGYTLEDDSAGGVVVRYPGYQDVSDVDLVGWRAMRQSYRQLATDEGASGGVLFEEYEGRHEAVAQLDLGQRASGELAIMPSGDPGYEDMYRFRSLDGSVEFSGTVSHPTDRVLGTGEVVAHVQVLEHGFQVRPGSSRPGDAHVAMLYDLQDALTRIMQLQVPDPPRGGTMLPVGWASVQMD